MAPKKKSPQQQQKQKYGVKAGKPQPSGVKAAPKLQISAENERRLRRLLMNTERPGPAAAPDANEGISREQKARKLRSIYDKLSLEGFTSEQIERALSALAEGATFECALDWLCFNLPGDELPLKFSSSGSITAVHEEMSIKVISKAQENWVPSQPSNEMNDEKFRMFIRIKGKEESLVDIGKPSQADWIREYVKQQEEQEQREEQEKEEQLDKEKVHATLWAIWSERNRGILKRDARSEDMVFTFVFDMVAFWERHLCKVEALNSSLFLFLGS